jgi:hypothetical protein
MTLTNSVTDPIAASLACLRGRLPPGSRVIVFGSQARGEASRTQLSSTPRTDQEPARQVDATRRGCAGYSFCRLRNSPSLRSAQTVLACARNTPHIPGYPVDGSSVVSCDA